MVCGLRLGHDEVMNETQQAPPTPGPEDEFDPHRLRSITDMKRSRDDRLLGGVCAGAAKYLNIDPVIVRVVIAVLTVVGFAGVILYVAAWFLLPSEDAEQSIAADWFNLDKNEERVRVVGLVVAGVLAILSVVGDNGWAWESGPWFLIPLALLYYLFVVRPRRRDPQTAAHAQAVADRAQAAGVAPGATTQDAATRAADAVSSGKPPRRPRRSWALTILTVSLAAIGVAVTRIYADLHDGVPWTTYVAIALGVVAVGLLVGTSFGHGGPLVALGIVLAVALAIGTLLPGPRIGEQRLSPTSAGEVLGEYDHGVGLLQLDLSQVDDADELLGSTVDLDSGVGQIKVIVPAELNVAVSADLDAGEIAVFDRRATGTDDRLDYPATGEGPTLTLDIHQRFGNIEVIRK